MSLFIITFVVFGLVIAAMALGHAFGRPIKRGCGASDCICSSEERTVNGCRRLG